jgi:hypothetical protein
VRAWGLWNGEKGEDNRGDVGSRKGTKPLTITRNARTREERVGEAID